MMDTAATKVLDVPRHWLFVLCLVGLDYFSTLAYLPSIFVEAAGPLAPFAALLIVFVTWALALPTYMYLVGRSPHGRGAIGLLDALVGGWRGKLLALTLLGFAATDFVVTRSLSIADATEHMFYNSYGHQLLDSLVPVRDACHTLLGSELYERVSPFVTRRVLFAVGLSILTFGLWYFLRSGFTLKVLTLAVAVVGCYLALTAVVVASGLSHLLEHPRHFDNWFLDVGVTSQSSLNGNLPWRTWLVVAVWSLPQASLGLSGFELTMAVAPLVRGTRRDTRDDPAGRIRNTRKLMLVAAAAMALLLMASTLVTTLLVPHAALKEGGSAQHRALAYLAHGEPLTDGQSATVLNGLFGDRFGAIYDASTATILCLAGASVMVGLGRLVPGYLHRMGMDVSWAGKVGVIMHLLNAVILLVTIVFRASLSDQLWAYATSILVLIAGAALAATIDVQKRCSNSRLRWLAATPFIVVFSFFIAAAALTVSINRSGIAIALAFVATILVTSFVSRWLRSTELRFEGFSFENSQSRDRWNMLCVVDRLILVPHRPGLVSLVERDRLIRDDYLLSREASVVFVEITKGDTSDFYQRPLVSVERDGDLDVIRVSKAVSVAHVLAAMALEIAKTGRPPTLLFGWSYETPLAANLNFIFLGEGNIPWMVKTLVRRAAPQGERQPRILIG